MLLFELLDAIDAAGVTLALDGSSIKAAGPGQAIDALRADIASHRDLLHAHLVGVATGHLLAFCEECHAPTITAAKTTSGGDRETWPTCRDTPGCGGRNQHGTARARHLPRPRDLAARRDSPAPPTSGRRPPKTPKARLLGPYPPWPTQATP